MQSGTTGPSTYGRLPGHRDEREDREKSHVTNIGSSAVLYRVVPVARSEMITDARILLFQSCLWGVNACIVFCSVQALTQVLRRFKYHDVLSTVGV